MSVDKNIVEKIKKVLALTQSPYPEEAMAAMLKAQELMAQHGLSMSDVNLEEKKPEKEVTDQSVYETRRMKWWIKQLSSIIGENFRCHPYYIARPNQTRMYFIGLKEDVELVKEVFNYAVIAVDHCAKAYIKKHKTPGVDGKHLKNDYIIGFLGGLRDKFKEQVASKCLSLVLVKDALVIKAVEDKKLCKGAKSKIKVERDDAARQAGYRDGMNFDSDRRMIQNT